MIAMFLWITRLVVVLASTLAGTGTTATSAATLTYDAPVVAHAEVDQADGTQRAITAAAVRSADSLVYNLTIDVDHTYYVGTDPVLVHNSKCFQMNREIQNGNAPSGIERADRAPADVPGAQDHVHFEGERSTLNRDGTWGHGDDPLDLTNKQTKWLRGHGWNL